MDRKRGIQAHSQISTIHSEILANEMSRKNGRPLHSKKSQTGSYKHKSPKATKKITIDTMRKHNGKAGGRGAAEKLVATAR